MYNKIIIFSLLILGLYSQTSHSNLISYQNIFSQLSESENILDIIPTGVDPNVLTLNETYNVNVHFVSEGAGYKNSLGWYIEGRENPRLSENRTIIWENASGTGNVGYTGGGDLSIGDNISLGLIEEGTTLGFFLTANGYYTGPSGHTFFTNSIYNPDSLDHVISSVLPDLGLIALGFEDIYGGGDNDYNDLIIAIDVGTTNAQHLINYNVSAVPAPATIWLFGPAILGLVGLNRRKAKIT